MSERKVVIVTGSSSGIGAAVARLAARSGHNVAVNYHGNREGGEQTADSCRAEGVEAIVLQGDVGSDESCRSIATAALEAWGRIDVLINNAGTTKFCPHGDLDGLDADDFHRLYQVNAVGAFQMIRAVAPALKLTGGSIVNVASIAGIKGVGSSLAYACSKAALLAINQSMARELGPEIRVNAVCPGMVEGEWLMNGLGEDLYPAVKKHYQSKAPTGQIMNDETVAENIWFFASSAPNVTGEQLILDGGATLPY
jgi:3-oxoacyl-[acyl-carrier protein] reductase